jgi:cyd operon protein YbgT
MWYFAWILGTGLAVTLAIMSGVWLELRLTTEEQNEKI